MQLVDEKVMGDCWGSSDLESVEMQTSRRAADWECGDEGKEEDGEGEGEGDC